jgi:hypothetical protein
LLHLLFALAAVLVIIVIAIGRSAIVLIFRLRVTFLPILTRAAGFFETGALFSDDTEIMVGELKIIFGHHPVTLQLGVASHILVLLQHLRRIAPRAAVYPTAVFIAIAVIILGPTTATAALLLLTIVIDQEIWSLNTQGRSNLGKWIAPASATRPPHR